LLLDHGADPTVRDPQGMTAADRAERNAMFEVARLLRQRE
jgi:ankyrin repeat protein